MTDCHIDTDHVLALLVQNGVCSDRCLARLTVTNDKLTLTSADGNHRVDSLNTGLQGHTNVLSFNNTGSRHFNGAVSFRLKGAFAVNRLTQSVYNTANQVSTHRHRYHLAGALYGIAFLDALISTQNNDTDYILFQVLGHTIGAIGELHQFAGHTAVQAADLGNAVTYQDNGAGLAGFQLILIILNLITNQLRNLIRS